MADVDEVIAATFEKAKGEEKCKVAAEGLKALYGAGNWEAGEILKVIATERQGDEAKQG